MCDLDDDYVEPVSEQARQLFGQLSIEKWRERVRDPRRKLKVLCDAEEYRQKTGESRRHSLEAVAPDVGWSCAEHWRRRLAVAEGRDWEALLDRRLPPRPYSIPTEVKTAAVALRQVSPNIDCTAARSYLVKQFGHQGSLGDSTLQTIWRRAGLNRAASGDADRFDDVQTFHGGGGLALLLAAEAEVGAFDALAGAVKKTGLENAYAQPIENESPQTASERDAHGRFTSDFNQLAREGVEKGQPDPRWDTEAKKRNRRSLLDLQILEQSKETLSQRLMAMGLIPLVTERRGFDGLDGPKGGWLEAVMPVGYMPSTLDKTLADLALLGVEDAMWKQHGTTWAGFAWHQKNEANKAMKWFVFYIDATLDPYWTREYALSGKISRTGNIGPCLTRVAVMGGPGVPLLIETTAGARSLKKDFLGVLDEVDNLIGEGEVKRVAVFDAESATIPILGAIAARPNLNFVTVLKGKAFTKMPLESPGEWVPSGEKDYLRCGVITLHGEGVPKEGLRLRVVERRRLDGRHPHTTRFATQATSEELTDEEVVSLYLTRWPYQEQHFRNARNGGGLNRSHGFGGENITHVAFETKLEQAQGKEKRAELAKQKAQVGVEQVEELHKQASGEEKENLQVARKASLRELKSREKALALATADREKQATMPREIYQRDVTKENIATVLKTAILVLLNYVLRDYFGGLKMEYRTFIEHFIHTPTVVRTRHNRILYQLQANPRNPKRTDQLRQACAAITSKKIRKNKRLMVFEVVEV